MQDCKNRKKQMTDETRGKIVGKYESGKPPCVISDELDIKYETVRSVLRIYKQNGRVNAIVKRASKARKITPEIESLIKTKISEDCSVTLKSLKDSVSREKDLAISTSSICRSIKNFNYSLKRVTLVPEVRNCKRVVDQRYDYSNSYLLLNEEKVVFLDEFGVSCSSRQSYGRSEIGSLARKIVRSIRSKNYSVSAAIVKSGLLFHQSLSTSFNGNLYLEFIRKVMTKMHDLHMQNYTLIMDNCTIHKVVGIREIIEQYGHNLLFLPPYSPQLNVIEEVFSKWKAHVKSANSNTTAELEKAILTGSSIITEKDCEGFFNHVRRYALKGIRRDDF